MKEHVAETLVGAGMSEGAAQDKALLFRAVERELGASRGGERWRWFVPGAFQILGKDTSCVGGRSLFCAAELGVCVSASARFDPFIRIHDVARGQTFTLQLASHQPPARETTDVSPAKLVRRLSRDFPKLRHGADICFASDLPSSAGMGSSSALMTAIAMALFAANAGDAEAPTFPSHDHLAEYLTSVETGESHALQGGAGLSAEYAAILLSRSCHLRQMRLLPHCVEADVAVPARCVFVVAVTGTQNVAMLASRASRVSHEVDSILRVWSATYGTTPRTLPEALNSLADAADRVRAALGSPHKVSDSQLLQRFKQFYQESEVIIPEAAAALKSEDLVRFGELVDQSQAASEHGSESPTLQTASLAQQARSLGAYAACTFGGGGSVWALVDRNDASNFSQRWRTSCATLADSGAAFVQFFPTEAGPALVSL